MLDHVCSGRAAYVDMFECIVRRYRQAASDDPDKADAIDLVQRRKEQEYEV